MITTECLSKSFGKIRALDNLNVRTPEGINGLIGPNGAGKTTFIHILVGLIRPDSGKVEVMGLDPWRQRHHIMKKVGVMLERPAFPQNVSGIRYMLHVTRVRRLPDDEAFKALRRVGLLGASERRISTYSAGMKARLGIAKALVGNPELVILDEPTANLDPLGRVLYLRMLKRMNMETGTNFLISSHVLPELQKVCSWVCLMHEGKVVEQDLVKNLIDRYSSATYIVEVSEPEKFASAIRNIGELKVEVRGNTVRIKGDVSLIRSEVPRLISQINCEVINFRQLGRSLESVFIKALRKRVNK